MTTPLAIVVAACTLTGVMEAWERVQTGVRGPLPEQCVYMPVPREMPVQEVVLGPGEDWEGDPIWIVRVAEDIYTLVWRNPNGRGL